MKRIKKYKKFWGNVLDPKHHFLQAYNIWIPHKKKVADIFLSHSQKITFIREFHYPDFFPKKNKLFLFFLNQCQKYGDFCENSHFFKNNGKKWVSIGAEISTRWQKFTQNNCFQIHTFYVLKVSFSYSFQSWSNAFNRLTFKKCHDLFFFSYLKFQYCFYFCIFFFSSINHFLLI